MGRKSPAEEMNMNPKRPFLIVVIVAAMALIAFLTLSGRDKADAVPAQVIPEAR